MHEQQKKTALAQFKKVFGKDLSQYVDSKNDLDLSAGKCNTKKKCLALARVLETNASTCASSKWNGTLLLERNNFDADCAEILATAMKSNTTVDLFSLFHNNIGARGAAAFKNTLLVNNTLKDFNLDDNSISDTGVKELKEALRDNNTLQRLSLNVNNIGDPGAKELKEVMQVNTTITWLPLWGNNISAELKRQIESEVEANDTEEGRARKQKRLIEQKAKEIEDDVAERDKQMRPKFPTSAKPDVNLLLKDEHLKVDSGHQLGVPGGSADVFKGTFKFPGIPHPEAVAVKIFRGSKLMSSSAIHRMLTHEVAIGFRVGTHPFLVQTHGYTFKPNVGVCIVMEVMTGGHLQDALSRGVFPDFESRLGWLINVSCGMEALHSMRPPIRHNDLKSLNVLLTGNKKVAKVGDFGLAKVTTTISKTTGSGTNRGSNAGTAGFKSPESYYGRVGPASDVFSFAMVLYHSLTGKLPFHDKSELEINTLMMKRFVVDAEYFEFGITEEMQQMKWRKTNPLSSRRPTLGLIRDDPPALLIELMENCWLDTPSDRPLFQDIHQVLLRVRDSWHETRHQHSHSLSHLQQPALGQRQEVVLLADILQELQSSRTVHGVRVEKILQVQEQLLDNAHELHEEVKLVRSELLENTKHISRVLTVLTTAFKEKPLVPWLFALIPDTRGKRLLTTPKKWGKKEYRIHLLCNGRKDKNIDPHFLFESEKDIGHKGKFRGYSMLEPRKMLKRFGPILKFVLGLFVLVAQGVINVYLPGLEGLIPGLNVLFSEENMDDIHDSVSEHFATICTSMTRLCDDEEGTLDKQTWQAPADDSYKQVHEDFAKFIQKQDNEKNHKFFGLKYYPNTTPGVGDGSGTPLWLCPKCYEGLKSHHEHCVPATP